MINSLVNHRHHSALAVDSVLHIMSHCVDRCTQTERHTHVEHIVAIVGCGQIETVVNMLNLVHRSVLDRTWTTVGWMFSSLRDGKPGRTRTQTLCILVPFFFCFVFVSPCSLLAVPVLAKNWQTHVSNYCGGFIKFPAHTGAHLVLCAEFARGFVTGTGVHK